MNYDNTIIRFNNYLVTKGMVDSIRWRSGAMDSIDFVTVQLLVAYIEDYEQLGNIIDITRLDKGLPFIYVNVADIKKARKLIEAYYSRDNRVVFLENKKAYDINNIRWKYTFVTEAPKENNKQSHTINIDGIHIGNISIDNVRIESSDKNMSESLQEAFNSILKNIKEIENKAKAEKIVEYKNDKREEVYHSKSKDDSIDFIKNCFDGYEIITMSVSQENMIEPVIDILPQIKPFLDTIIGESECTILITNTGTVFFKVNDNCSMLCVKDGKKQTQIVHNDFVDLLTTGTNARHIAVELELQSK